VSVSSGRRGVGPYFSNGKPRLDESGVGLPDNVDMPRALEHGVGDLLSRGSPRQPDTVHGLAERDGVPIQASKGRAVFESSGMRSALDVGVALSHALDSEAVAGTPESTGP
jgi:hypothetical protein